MNEHPILFSTEMVRAILDGRKTQTRRIMKPQPELGQNNSFGKAVWCWDKYFWGKTGISPNVLSIGDNCPYGNVGDMLWVREAWCYTKMSGYDARDDGGEIWYRATDSGVCEGPWKPSIHMFRKHARIFLEITNIRVERVQDISENDAEAEGTNCDRTYLEDFENLWDSLNTKRGYGWDKNPWVWVIEFTVESKD